MNQPRSRSPEFPDGVSSDALLQLGWALYVSNSPFTAPHGAMYQKIDDNGVCWRAFCARKMHCNSAGIVHGGMLATFMDALMGLTVAHGAQTTALTVHLTIEYPAIARPGDWIIGQSRITQLTDATAYVEGEAHAGARQLISAQGVFKLMRRRAPRAK